MSMLFAMASAISLSFNLHFEMISNMIALVDRHTSLFQFLIVWLMHLLIPLSLVILVVGTTRHAFHKNKLPTVPGPLSLTRPSFNKAFAYQGASRSSASGNTSSGTRFTSSDAKSTFSGADSSFSEEADPSVENAASSNGTAKDSIVDPDGAFIDPDLAEIVSRSSDQTSSVSDEDASLSSTDKTAETGNKDAENNTPVSAPGFLVPILTFLSYLDYQFARFGDFLLCKFFRKRSIIDIFMVGMTFVGFLLL